MKHDIIKDGKCGDQECFAVEQGLLRPLVSVPAHCPLND